MDVVRAVYSPASQPVRFGIFPCKQLIGRRPGSEELADDNYFVCMDSPGSYDTCEK